MIVCPATVPAEHGVQGVQARPPRQVGRVCERNMSTSIELNLGHLLFETFILVKSEISMINGDNITEMMRDRQSIICISTQDR